MKFILHPQDLALINNEGKSILEPGEFEVYIGEANLIEGQKLTGTAV